LVERTVIGLLHPGEMGSAVGRCLASLGHEVLWASKDRGPKTAERARTAGLTDAGSVAAIASRAKVILSICPPHAALDVAASVTGFRGFYVDANAIAPQTAAEVARTVERGGASYVDGGIIGPPPAEAGNTRLYLSGAFAGTIAGLFSGAALDTRVLDNGDFAASGIKMAYAAWTKGSAALLLAARALADSAGVTDALLAEWQLSQPQLEARFRGAEQSATAKGWRWVGEMKEIAIAMTDADLPDGFHRAAAEVYRGFPGSTE
jgi:3-hydroxyisobutyrate dehydrogenase-like beta-hydroxyacid dehydrogenase